jgi:DNA-directed RNA polymerase specialized sigma24 family protein
MKTVLRHVRRLALMQAGDRATDAHLLQAFLDRHDEAAFEGLLRRHGPMVLGVCRRVLGNVHDAEDAFQASFFVLARKADSVRPREMVGPWLYGVALRTALKARAMNAKRLVKERGAGELPEPGDGPPEELLARLDEELGRLPERYRLPVVLCEPVRTVGPEPERSGQPTAHPRRHAVEPAGPGQEAAGPAAVAVRGGTLSRLCGHASLARCRIGFRAGLPAELDGQDSGIDGRGGLGPGG